MRHSVTASRQAADRVNPVIFPLHPEAQWGTEKPKDIGDVWIIDLPQKLSDVVISRSVKERWVYEVGSSLVHPDLRRLHNFDVLFRSSEIARTQRRVQRAVPEWIRKWAKELEEAGVMLKGGIEEARRISRKFKTPLSEEIIAERDERR